MEKVSGLPFYVDDLEFPNMLHAATIRSSRPHARILSVDAEGAFDVPGVIDVLSSRDIPGTNAVPMILDDMPFLAQEEVRYFGEPIALVVATSRRAAKEGASRVKVRYEDMEAVFDPIEAMGGGIRVATKGHDPSRNVFSKTRIRNGDVERAVKESEYVVGGSFRIPSQEHLYMEPIAVVAVPRGGGVEVLGPFQAPQQDYVQRMVSAATGLPMSSIAVKVTTIGGAFGGKEEIPGIPAAHAAVAALRTGKPVKIAYDREEDFVATSKRHPGRITLSIGADEEGRLTFLRAEIILDAGAYSTLSPAVLWLATVMTCVPYRIPNVEINGYAVATNNVPRGAFRGFGNPQVSIPRELLLDELARKAGLEPYELRLRNLVSPGDSLCFGQEVGIWGGARATLEKLLSLPEAKEIISMRGARSGRFSYGVGISSTAIPIGLGATGKPLERASAVIELRRDGSLTLKVGGVDMGTGVHHAMALIASRIIGVPPERIYVPQVDTSTSPDAGPTVASRSVAFIGAAVANASRQLLSKMLELAGEILGPGARIEGGKACGPGGKCIGIAELAEEAYGRGMEMRGESYIGSPPDLTWDEINGKGVPYPFYSHASQLTLVRLDLETGVVDPIEVLGVYDVGPVIDPQGAEAQAIGGTTMGLGYVLYEEIKAERGRILNPNFTDYVVPSIMDIPRMRFRFIEGFPSGMGEPGSKGLGELPMVASSSSAACAVADALGKMPLELPFTPERVWKNIKREK